MIKSLLREPLLHFILIGATLFAVDGIWGQFAEPEERQIVVTQERVRHLKATWEKQWRRPPTEEELGNLIDEFVREEILYREGVGMGLDKEDTVIRRRMAQKVRFLIEDMTVQGDPGEEALKNYFEQNSPLFLEPERVSFTHLYFSIEKRRENADTDARRLLAELEKVGAEDVDKRSDPFIYPNEYSQVTHGMIAPQLGEKFADAVFGLPPGKWQGPIHSGFGVHLVWVSERSEAQQPDFSEVSAEVRAAFMEERRRRINEEAIRAMAEKYKVVFEGEGRRGGAESS